MATYRHIVTIPYDSGLPEDVAVNTFHSLGGSDIEAEAFAALLPAFYAEFDGDMSSLLNGSPGACTIRTYDLADPIPRAPIGEETFAITTGANTLPTELAICCSFQGDQVSGIPQSRQRGRVYLGPWAMVTQSVTGRPDSNTIDRIRTAADNLLTASNGVGVAKWCVHSPTNNSAVPVTNGWVDNEWDIMRKRGQIPTVRGLW